MATDGIAKELQSLQPSAMVEMFSLDLTSFGGDVMHFHAGTNKLSTDIVWQGISYIAMPAEAEGFAVGSNGALPRPKIRIANTDGAFSATVMLYNDLIGAKLYRKRTFAKYMDAINFAGGVNPSANPNQHFEDEMWFVDRKSSENRYMIEWELASAFDLNGVMLPTRQIRKSSCPWAYRSADCTYTGSAYFTATNASTTSIANDVCGKTVASCEKRFGVNAILPIGSFPGVTQYS